MMENYREAIERYEVVIKFQDDNKEAKERILYNLGNCYYNIGDYK